MKIKVRARATRMTSRKQLPVALFPKLLIPDAVLFALLVSWEPTATNASFALILPSTLSAPFAPAVGLPLAAAAEVPPDLARFKPSHDGLGKGIVVFISAY